MFGLFKREKETVSYTGWRRSTKRRSTYQHFARKGENVSKCGIEGMLDGSKWIKSGAYDDQPNPCPACHKALIESDIDDGIRLIADRYAINLSKKTAAGMLAVIAIEQEKRITNLERKVETLTGQECGTI